MNAPHWTDHLLALAQRDQPGAAFASFAAIAQVTVGFVLLTVTLHDPRTGLMRRVFSTNEDVYPVGGFKPVRQTKFTEATLGRRVPFIAQTAAELSEVFLDHDKMAALGCASICNVPVEIDGEVAGTYNLSGTENYFDPPRIAAALDLRPYIIPAFLLIRPEPI